jgi:hypothetical protein
MAYDGGMKSQKAHGHGKHCHTVFCLTCHDPAMQGCKYCKKCSDKFTAADKQRQRQRVGSRGQAAGSHWQDADGPVSQAVAFCEDVVDAALVVPAAALGIATNVSANTARAGLNVVRTGENVADATARGAIREAQNDERRVLVLAHIRAENPDIDDEEAHATLRELFHPSNATYIDELVRSLQSNTAPAHTAAKPAGARATMDVEANRVAARAAARDVPHASGKACNCYRCVVKTSSAVATPNAGGRATAPEPSQPRASSAEAQEFRRRASNGNGHHNRATARTPPRSDRHNESAPHHHGHGTPNSGAANVDSQLRAAGFSYSCHMCRAEVTTSKCDVCMAAVPQDHIDEALGAPSAGSTFMDGMGTLVDGLTLF